VLQVVIIAHMAAKMQDSTLCAAPLTLFLSQQLGENMAVLPHNDLWLALLLTYSGTINQAHT